MNSLFRELDKWWEGALELFSFDYAVHMPEVLFKILGSIVQKNE